MDSSTRLLLIEDDEKFCRLLRDYLVPLGYEVDATHDGRDGLARAQAGGYAAVILDVMLPRMSGFEACRRIKDATGTRDTVIIMVTALNEVGDFERAVESGCDDFLTKPVNKLELTTRVKSLLRVRLLKRKVDALLRERRQG